MRKCFNRQIVQNYLANHRNIAFVFKHRHANYLWIYILANCQSPKFIPHTCTLALQFLYRIYSRKFSRYVYFVVRSLIRIISEKISRMAYNEASFQLKMMLSSEFLRTKFLLLINHPQKPRKFPAIRYFTKKQYNK